MCTFLSTVCAAQTIVGQHQIDLSAWGYKPVQFGDVLHLDLPIVSIGPDKQLVIGFPTHDRFGLATRTRPPLSLHIVRLTAHVQFVSDNLVSTSTWTVNRLYLLHD